MVDINEVEPDSIAEEMGILPGDKLLKVNNKSIRDYIDFQYEIADDKFSLVIEKKDGDLVQLVIEKNPDEKLGIILNGIIYDELKKCQNNCIFCFIKQQPEGLRNSLLLKDDDYRFSFLQGIYITLTNLTENDYKRIFNLNLSPLNISVHTTNSSLRIDMMKNPEAGNILKHLYKLKNNNISFNTQVVLCPGYNDGKELDKTITDLLKFSPELISIGVVPVGLTKYRTGLKKLKKYDSKEATTVLNQIKKWQQKISSKLGRNILYAADELYLLSGESIPGYNHYNGFPQLENGIGLTCVLYNNFNQIKDQLVNNKVNNKSIGLITSVLGERALSPIVEKLNTISGLKVNVIVIHNNFFGELVTVTGLLTGQDIINKLKKMNNLPEQIILPGVLFNDRGLFLDDFSLKDIKIIFPDIRFSVINNINEILEVINYV